MVKHHTSKQHDNISPYRCLLVRAELQAELDHITLMLVNVKHKTDALGEPDHVMHQTDPGEDGRRRKSGAGCGDLKLYLRGEARSQLLQPFYIHLETCIPSIDSIEFLIFNLLKLH